MVTEVTHLFVPGPGVVEGYARVVIKPVRGRVGDLSVALPEGFAVSAIEGATSVAGVSIPRSSGCRSRWTLLKWSRSSS
jgi:hypothetical protein